MMKALSTGIAGQDGCYLVNLYDPWDNIDVDSSREKSIGILPSPTDSLVEG